MIEISVPEKVAYNELVLRTITNISIKQLCYYSETLEDLIQAYDLKEKKNNKKKITNVDEYNIRNLETKYHTNLSKLANVYEEYYKCLSIIEISNMSRTFANMRKSMLDKLDEIMNIYGIAI